MVKGHCRGRYRAGDTGGDSRERGVSVGCQEGGDLWRGKQGICRGGSRGSVGVLVWEEGCPWRSWSVRRVSVGVWVGKKRRQCGNWGVLGDVDREAGMAMEKQG